MRTLTRHQTARSAFLTVAIAPLLIYTTGCASINRNANAVVLGGILGAAGGVAGFAATNCNGEGAAAGAAAGAAIGGAIGHQIDKLIWRKEAERSHAACPHCSAQVNVSGFRVGQRAHCSRCGGEFLVTNR